MELNRLLGVEKVTMYTDGKRLKYDLRKTIDYYSHLGSATVPIASNPFQSSPRNRIPTAR